MGVGDLWLFLRCYMHLYDIEELIRSGRKYIALDASVLQYQALYRHPEDCLPGESIHNFLEFFVQRIEILFSQASISEYNFS
jgi:hypothetical protein